DTVRAGAYVIASTKGEPDTTIAASGSEVALAMEAAKLAVGKSVRVVSVLDRELFLSQPAALRHTIVPPGSRVVACEAGRSMGWDALADDFLGIERFGESGPGAQVAAHLGLTAEALAAKL
ncbi:MAG: transketolase, partial [Spirochaetia bacterium]|nr:transketolase [Spirochaetia bacterium]